MPVKRSTPGRCSARRRFPPRASPPDTEAAVLHDAGLTAESFAGFGKLLMGTRRHNLVYVDDLIAESEADGLRMTFTLPAGSYATVLLREVMKQKSATTAEASVE